MIIEHTFKIKEHHCILQLNVDFKEDDLVVADELHLLRKHTAELIHSWGFV